MREAPPTRPPSMSFCANSSGAVFAFTEPPYWIRLLPCSCLIINLSDASADSCANFLCLLGSSGFSGSNRPNRLISNHCGLCLVCSHVLETDFHLLTDEIHSYTLLSLSQSFTTAHDRGNAVLECFKNFFVYCLIGLSEVFSSLRMSDNNVFYANIRKHCRRNLASVCAFLFVVHVLSANLNIGTFAASITGIMSMAGTQNTTSTSSFLQAVLKSQLILLPRWESCSFSSFQRQFSFFAIFCSPYLFIISFNKRFVPSTKLAARIARAR